MSKYLNVRKSYSDDPAKDYKDGRTSLQVACKFATQTSSFSAFQVSLCSARLKHPRFFICWIPFFVPAMLQKFLPHKDLTVNEYQTKILTQTTNVLIETWKPQGK